MRLKNRKGAILVLAAFLMAAVLGVLVVVVDFSRIYVQKTELQTAADAAALAGTREIMNGAPDVMVEDSALNYGERNKALSTTVPIARADVICGQWVAATRTYADESANCNPGHNSVTVTTRQTARHSLPGFLGANWQIKATARAYAAYVGAQKCIKPWAIPYPRLTKILDPNNPDSLRNLTEGDISTLRGLPLADRRLMLKIRSPPTSGNLGSLEIPDAEPDAPSAGANLYQYNIEECNTTLIGPGDTIDTEPGGMTGPTKNGVEAYCDKIGNFDKPTGNCYDEEGNLGIVVKAALWSNGTTRDNGRYAVVVRQIVSFVLENISQQVEITGYFLPYLTIGEITPNPTTTQRLVLIK